MPSPLRGTLSLNEQIASYLARRKTLHCKAPVASLGGVLEGEPSDEGQRQFARACNDIQIFAPANSAVVAG